MSRPIKMTEQYLRECREDFEKALKLTKLADGKLNFTKVFSCKEQKATVFFTPEAWAKMVILIKDFDKEVAWHGVAQRTANDGKNEYVISDILVYPQTVSGASVEMDTEEYAKWLMANAEDERFNNIHMQGHSHVNMATSPSGVDLNHQEEILNMLGDDDFYIFMIWNKSFSSNIKIYDLKKNVLFENGDITVKIAGGSEDLDTFLKNAKDMVKTKTVQYNVGAYGWGIPPQQGKPQTKSVPNSPNQSVGSVTAPPKTEGGNAQQGGKKQKPRSKIDAGWKEVKDDFQTSMPDYLQYLDDDDDSGTTYGYSGVYHRFYDWGM